MGLLLLVVPSPHCVCVNARYRNKDRRKFYIIFGNLPFYCNKFMVTDESESLFLDNI